MVRCLIALGANIGASEELFDAALKQLEHLTSGQQPIVIQEKSRTFRTKPVGENAGGEFLNAAATLETALPPDRLLRVLHDVEAHFGRVRSIHWGPRRLDLDLILYGDEVMDRPDIVVPHPACWYRRFVLDPAHQIAAEMRHPLLGESIREMHSRLHARPLVVDLHNGTAGFEITGIISKLNADPSTSGIQWEDSRLPDNQPGRFASIRIHRCDDATESPSSRSQPRLESGRSHVILADTVEQAIREIRLLCDAVLGSS